jgi:hypothetical protein
MERTMIRTITIGLLTALAFAAAAPGQAEKSWLLPSATVFSGNEGWVSVDAANSGDLFFADHRPGNLDQIKVWAPDGTPGRIQNGAMLRRRAVFDVQLDKPGTWKIGTQNAMLFGSYKLNGEEHRVGGRGGRGPGSPGGAPGAGGGDAPRPPAMTVADIPPEATDVKITQVSSRNEIFVTLGVPTRTLFAPTGSGLEFDPVTHPDELVTGEPARFRFLVDGKPAAGLHVTVVPGGTRYRNAENAMELVAGADGVVTVKWPAAGLYWLGATLTDDKPTEPRATERRLSYSATLEVLTP